MKEVSAAGLGLSRPAQVEYRRIVPLLGERFQQVDLAALLCYCEAVARRETAHRRDFQQLAMNMRVSGDARAAIDIEHWKACRSPITRDEQLALLAGRRAYAGLDVTSRFGLTVLVLLFPPEDESERIHLLSSFWMPRGSVRKYETEHQLPYTAWAAASFIKLTDGNGIDHKVIKKRG